MSDTLLIAFLLLIYLGVAANVLTMILVSHTTKKLPYAIIGGVFSGLVVVVAGALNPALESPALTTTNHATLMLLACLSYLAYSFCFWTLINLNITSLRIRIVREILSYPNAQVPASELHDAYNPHTAFENRMKRMIAGGQLIKTDKEKYKIGSPIVLLIAKTLHFLRRVTLPRYFRK